MRDSSSSFLKLNKAQRKTYLILAAIIIFLLLTNPTVTATNEDKVTVPINQVVNTAKLSAEQLAKAKVTVPISWVNKEYLKKHDYTEQNSTQIEHKGIPDNIPDGTYTQEPEITSKQSDVIKISNFKFGLTYNEGSLVKADVTFSLKNDSGVIKDVVLNLEGEKQLTPTDGKFDEATEEFSQTVKGLKEGNLYRGTLEVEGGSNSDSIDFKIYPREFVNIADDDDMKIVAHYFPWKYEKNDEDLVYHLLMGDYAPTNQEDINRHIDWATGHGIDAFALSWNGIDNHTTSKNINSHLLRADLINDIQFMIDLDQGSWHNPLSKVVLNENTEDREEMREVIRYFNEHYFDNPQYLEIQGKKPIFFYGSRVVDFNGNITLALNEMRDITEEYNNQLYIIGDVMGFGLIEDEPWVKNRLNEMEKYDAVSTYTQLYNKYKGDYSNFVNKNSKLFSKVKRKVEADFIPYVQPGNNDSKARPNNPSPILERERDIFRRFCVVARENIEAGVNMIFITSWNEWNESTQVEPAKEYGFKYLEIIMDELAGDG